MPTRRKPHTTTAARQAGAGIITSRDLLEMYRVMVMSRVLDERIWLLNRQGKAAIVASAQGHEAAQVACVWATDRARDHYLIYYRELTTLLALGLTPLDLLKGFLARDGEPLSGARQFPTHGAHRGVDVFSFSNVVGTQLPQAAGVALADKMRGEAKVTVVYFGDGAASQGDCHEAMNFAGIHRLPVVFFCENNRYAISVPLSKQMAIEGVAERAAGYGMPGVTVDGTDVVAVYEAVRAAAERARNGHGPSLVEVMVERLFPHTSDDDHTRYRTAEDIKGMREKDPIPIMEALLGRQRLLSTEAREAIWAEAKRTVNVATEEAEATPFPSAREFRAHVFADA
ncbi:MAG: thiamine pyrophosphate-dependent dehydrogenase E1 component subunit alpha [SAR202 cluster bacterium]|nr:thiamine pyrophosphate-dependent dehydrogenase E1 component subunit alpha [SAR202 cluster bacterium]